MTEERIAEFAKSIVLRFESCYDITGLERTFLFYHAKAEIRLAIKESSEEKDEVIRRLVESGREAKALLSEKTAFIRDNP